MNERELLNEEAHAAYELYQRVQGSVPEKVIREKKHSEIVFKHEGKEYRLIFDTALDWFLDMAFVIE